MTQETIRVLVVDDSAYNRRTIIRMLEELPQVKVVDYACDGEEALRKAIDLEPDLVTLDLEMPRMDGFTVLRILMQNKPVPVIVVSSRSDDENVFRAMEFGAVTFIPKPSARISPELFNIRDDLHEKVKALVKTDMQKVLRRSTPEGGAAPRRRVRSAVAKSENESPIELVAIGASTGGPPALQKIFSEIQEKIPVGFVISQHMPPGFTKAFAERLNKFSALDVKEAETGDMVRPGQVLVAPGGKNLTFRRRGEEIVVEIDDPLPGQRYVPSVDVMFNSASEFYGPSVLGVVLTGMGNDGAEGTARISQGGGRIFAESEESSVVFGMPKEAIATGKVSRVVILDRMCDSILGECGF
ncbi:MAG: chemotaxis response regulator protein-glutamate methylesterase [Desulfuromonas sp.]|nr:MAG: chemotaxis response regulator protein-glutamate methylesterase [Desulfuromonas sp.]